MVYIALESFTNGGHIERGSYSVKKSAKPKPAKDNKLKQMTEAYLKYKEDDRLAYLREQKAKEEAEAARLAKIQQKQQELDDKLAAERRLQQEKEAKKNFKAHSCLR